MRIRCKPTWRRVVAVEGVGVAVAVRAPARGGARDDRGRCGRPRHCRRASQHPYDLGLHPDDLGNLAPSCGASATGISPREPWRNALSELQRAAYPTAAVTSSHSTAV